MRLRAKQKQQVSPQKLSPELYTPHKIHLHGRKEDTPIVMTKQVAEELRMFLPPLQKESNHWDLVYSIDQHGISITTMFLRAQEANCPCILIIKTISNGILGAYLSEPPCMRKGYYGNGTWYIILISFLWKQLENGGLAAYLTTGVNEHYILSESGAPLAFGGGYYILRRGNGFSLWIDEQLLKAHTGSTSTYGNPPLTLPNDFEIAGLELWAIKF